MKRLDRKYVRCPACGGALLPGKRAGTSQCDICGKEYIRDKRDQARS